MAKIVFNRKDCIGAGECELLSPELWKMKNDSKAELIGAKLNSATGLYELDIDDSQVELQRKVAGSCPSTCIKIMV